MANILFVIDSLELKYFEFNDLVTNFWIIKSLLLRNHKLFITTIHNLALINNQPFANCFSAQVCDTNVRNQDLVYDKNPELVLLDDFDLIFFRPDPPVDSNYINATYIFDFVNRDKVKIINDPKSIRNFNEKLHTSLFPDFTPLSIVSSSKSLIKNFVSQHSICVLKPLNLCFGSGVFFLKNDDPNLNTIISSATQDGTKSVIVQKYVQSPIKGDIRVLLLGDNVLPYALNKLPLVNDFKFSVHNDSYLKKVSLSQDTLFMAQSIAKKLNQLDLPLVGLDIIDNNVIEINITSPCYFIREINNLFNMNLENLLADFFENYLHKNNSQYNSVHYI